MKKFVAGSMLAAVAFAGSSVYAHEDKREEAKETRTLAKQENEVRKEEKKVEKTVSKEAKRIEQRKENILKFWNNMKKRLGLLIRNQDRLASRIEKKIAKMKEQGKDVAAAEVQLVEARRLIGLSREGLAKGDTAVANIMEQNSDPKIALEKVKVVNKEILERIKTSHKGLVKVLELLSGKTPTPSPSLSSTATPSPSPSPSPTS